MKSTALILLLVSSACLLACNDQPEPYHLTVADMERAGNSRTNAALGNCSNVMCPTPSLLDNPRDHVSRESFNASLIRGQRVCERTCRCILKNNCSEFSGMDSSDIGLYVAHVDSPGTAEVSSPTNRDPV